MIAVQNDIELLESLYIGRKAYHGELHDHANTGGTSDGGRTLEHWKGAMEALQMDFAAILDHRQVRHMYLPEWDKELFICGTEPGTRISDSKAEDNSVHYNMIFSSPKPLEELLCAHPEYQFEGGSEGHFIYPEFTREKFGELMDEVRARGGFFVQPHPKQQMQSDDPLEYWYRDETGLEVFYNTIDSQASADNYVLWTTLLSYGKRIWACAGGDLHACANDGALTTIYSENRTNEAYLSHLRNGDFVCGPVGIKMGILTSDNRIAGCKMGGQCSFDGARLILGISDFHKSVRMPGHIYRVDIINDKGIVCSHEFSCTQPAYFALDTQDCSFYRAEVFDVTRNIRIAIGNPIWNLK